MGGAPLLLALAVVTVDYGWESDGRDGYRYIVQVPAEQLHDIERTGKITSRLPPELRGRVSSIEIRVGDGEVPRPAVTPAADSPAAGSSETESPNAESPHVAAAGTEFPGPEETVRGQGESSQFSYPPEEEVAATDPAESDTAAAPPANGFGTSDFGGFARPRSTPTSTSTRQDAPSTSRPQSAPSTSRADGTPSASGGNYAADSRSNGFATDSPRDTATRDNRWSSTPSGTGGAASPQGGEAATADDPPSLRTGPTQQPAAASSATDGNAAATGKTAATGDTASHHPPATGSTSSGSSASGGAAAAGTGHQPRAGYPASSTSSPPAASLPPRASARPESASEFQLTPEARQRLADQQLLEEVGVDISGYPYVKSTGMPLRQDDPWYPAWVDYATRMQQAAAATSRATRLATPRPITDSRSFDSAQSPSDPYGYGSQWGSAEPYQPVATRQPPADEHRARNSSGSMSPPKTKSAEDDEDEEESRRSGASGDREAASASDFGTAGGTADRQRSVAAQPLFNFLLLLSLIGNVYLGIAISRLIRRYRNLVSTQRGSILPGQ